MLAERFGSYSIAATRAGIPTLSRLKSITRYRRESSEKSETLMSRRPGVTGRKVRTGIALHSLEELDALALGQPHERLLPLGLAPLVLPDAAQLRRHPHRAHALDLHVEQSLHGALDVVLARARVDRERDDVARLAGHGALLGGERLADHIVDVHEDSARLAVLRRSSDRRASIASTAPTVSTSCLCRSTSYTLSPSTRITPTRSRLRAEISSFSSASAITISTLWPASPSAVRIPATRLVLSSESASSSTTVIAPSCWRSDSAPRSAARRTFFDSECS